MIDPMSSPCVMCEGEPCIDACEPNVLSRALPLKMGTASIRTPNCLAYNGTICTVCSERCPVEGAIDLIGGRPRIDEATCTGCGVCQHVCPAPYNAVLILPDQTRLGRPDRDASASPAPFDWRAAYLGDRDLTPPGSDAGGRQDC